MELDAHFMFIRFYCLRLWNHKNDNGQIIWDDCFVRVCVFVFAQVARVSDDDVNQKLKSKNVIY